MLILCQMYNVVADVTVRIVRDIVTMIVSIAFIDVRFR
jgi:hypothetical protein